MKFSTLGVGFATAATVMVAGLNVASASTVTVQSGQSLWNIAQSKHVSVSSLEKANPSVDPANLQPGTKLHFPTQPRTYTVQPGDTFWKLALRFHLDLTELEGANPTVEPRDMLIGSTLTLPQGSVNASAAVQVEARRPAVTQTQPATTQSQVHSVQNSTNLHSTDVNSTDLYWMERVIHAEAEGEPLDAQIAVGDVILHRMEASGYGNSVKDVAFQVSNGHYQFSCVANGSIYTTPSQTNHTAAVAVLQNHTDVIPGALVFYNPSQTPASSWVRQQPFIKTIGDFIFAR